MAEERRLTSQGRERKGQLLDCAARLFAERGFAETRIVDICRAAGVAKGLFYWYFENKEQLFAELAADIRDRLRRSQGEAIDPGADAITRIAQGTAASVRFMAEHASFFSLLEAESVERRFVEVLRTGTEIHVADVAALIRDGQQDDLIRQDDPLLLARGVVGVVAVYAQFHRTRRADQPIDDLAEFVARFVVRSLAASSAIADAAETRRLASPSVS